MRVPSKKSFEGSEQEYPQTKRMSELINLIGAYRTAVSTKDREESLGALLEFINPDIYLFFLGRVSDEDAQDLRSVTLTDIARGITKFKGATSSEAWAWCYTIAKRKLAAHFEEKGASGAVPMDPVLLTELAEASVTTMPFETEEQWRHVQEAIEILRNSDPDCFHPLWDYLIMGMDYDELAAKGDKSYDAVRMQVSRCLDKIEPLLN